MRISFSPAIYFGNKQEKLHPGFQAAIDHIPALLREPITVPLLGKDTLFFDPRAVLQQIRIGLKKGLKPLENNRWLHQQTIISAIPNGFTGDGAIEPLESGEMRGQVAFCQYPEEVLNLKLFDLAGIKKTSKPMFVGHISSTRPFRLGKLSQLGIYCGTHSFYPPLVNGTGNAITPQNLTLTQQLNFDNGIAPSNLSNFRLQPHTLNTYCEISPQDDRAGASIQVVVPKNGQHNTPVVILTRKKVAPKVLGGIKDTILYHGPLYKEN